MIRLKSAVLHMGKGCPVCGGEKTEKARTCRKCRLEIGVNVTAAVDKVAEAIHKAKEGHEVANRGKVLRDIVFGPVLSLVEINQNAQLKRGNGVGDYLDSRIYVSGGYIPIFLFGAGREYAGQVVTALVELKTKQRGRELVHYLRAQKVDDLIFSDVALSVVGFREGGRLEIGLPMENIKEYGRSYKVGFSRI